MHRGGAVRVVVVEHGVESCKGGKKGILLYVCMYVYVRHGTKCALFVGRWDVFSGIGVLFYRLVETFFPSSFFPSDIHLSVAM